MDIKSITSLNFGKIYKESANYSDSQKRVIEDIEKFLYTKPNRKKTFYKILENRGYDVLLTPTKDDGKISLGLLRNFKFTKKSIAPIGGNVSRLHVGTYDDSLNPFNPMDISNTIYNRENFEKNSNTFAKIMFGLLVATLLSIPLWAKHVYRLIRPNETQKVMEATDTLTKNNITFHIK